MKRSATEENSESLIPALLKAINSESALVSLWSEWLNLQGQDTAVKDLYIQCLTKPICNIIKSVVKGSKKAKILIEYDVSSNDANAAARYSILEYLINYDLGTLKDEHKLTNLTVDLCGRLLQLVIEQCPEAFFELSSRLTLKSNANNPFIFYWNRRELKAETKVLKKLLTQKITTEFGWDIFKMFKFLKPAGKSDPYAHINLFHEKNYLFIKSLLEELFAAKHGVAETAKINYLIAFFSEVYTQNAKAIKSLKQAGYTDNDVVQWFMNYWFGYHNVITHFRSLVADKDSQYDLVKSNLDALISAIDATAASNVFIFLNAYRKLNKDFKRYGKDVCVLQQKADATKAEQIIMLQELNKKKCQFKENFKLVKTLNDELGTAKDKILKLKKYIRGLLEKSKVEQARTRETIDQSNKRLQKQTDAAAEVLMLSESIQQEKACSEQSAQELKHAKLKLNEFKSELMDAKGKNSRLERELESKLAESKVLCNNLVRKEEMLCEAKREIKQGVVQLSTFESDKHEQQIVSFGLTQQIASRQAEINKMTASLLMKDEKSRQKDIAEKLSRQQHEQEIARLNQQHKAFIASLTLQHDQKVSHLEEQLLVQQQTENEHRLSPTGFAGANVAYMMPGRLFSSDSQFFYNSNNYVGMPPSPVTTDTTDFSSSGSSCDGDPVSNCDIIPLSSIGCEFSIPPIAQQYKQQLGALISNNLQVDNYFSDFYVCVYGSAPKFMHNFKSMEVINLNPKSHIDPVGVDLDLLIIFTQAKDNYSLLQLSKLFVELMNKHGLIASSKDVVEFNKGESSHVCQLQYDAIDFNFCVAASVAAAVNTKLQLSPLSDSICEVEVVDAVIMYKNFYLYSSLLIKTMELVNKSWWNFSSQRELFKKVVVAVKWLAKAYFWNYALSQPVLDKFIELVSSLELAELTRDANSFVDNKNFVNEKFGLSSGKTQLSEHIFTFLINLQQPAKVNCAALQALSDLFHTYTETRTYDSTDVYAGYLKAC